MSDPLWINSGKASSAIGTATIDTGGTFTLTGHGLADGETVTVDTLTGGASSALTADAVYFVRDATTDTFAVTLTLHGPVVTLGSSGGADVYTWAPGYSAQELRRAGAVRLYPGVASEFGARAGVRPHSTNPISVAGTTWTVNDLTAVVAGPGSGPYEVGHPEESGAIDPADGSNPRIDALDLQIQDDDEDASGQRRARVVYTAGTPGSSPLEPDPTANSLRLGTIDVPAGGSPGPSVRSQAPWTVASGGIVPLHDDDTAPTSGVYEGAYADQTEALLRRTGSAWVPVASPNSPTLVHMDSSGTFVKADYPWGRKLRYRLQGAGGGGGGSAATSAGEAAAAAGGGAGGYVEAVIGFADLSSSETVTIGSGGSGGAAGNNDGSTGSNTSLGSHAIANGGEGGQGGAATSGTNVTQGGGGGSGTINTGTGFVRQGGRGDVGGNSGGVVGNHGRGGHAMLGPGSATSDANAGGAGIAGGVAGGGGSGAFAIPSQSAFAGGDGARGSATFEVY